MTYKELVERYRTEFTDMILEENTKAREDAYTCICAILEVKDSDKEYDWSHSSEGFDDFAKRELNQKSQEVVKKYLKTVKDADKKFDEAFSLIENLGRKS